MVTLDYEYTRNLEYFLENSEEDEVDSLTFLKQFSKKYKFSKRLKWLDVGAGPGTKPIRILKGVSNHKGLLDVTNVTLDLVEPSIDWQKILLQNFQQNGLMNIIKKLHPLKWEDFIKHKEETYDLITFFHSVYGIQINSLKYIPKYLKKDGYACIIIESPNSDLHKIKKSLFPYIHHIELTSSSKTVIKFLEKNRINYKIEEDEPDQKFYIDEFLNQNNPRKVEPLSFILQTKPEDYNRLVSEGTQNKIYFELKKYVKKDGKGRAYINVPDRFIWIYKN